MTEVLINYVLLCFIVKEFNKRGQCAKRWGKRNWRNYNA